MTQANPPRGERQHDDFRRPIVLVLAIGLLCGSALAWWLGREGAARFAAAAMGRIGLLLAALWLAWPSLRRPAKWLPPSVSVMVVVFLSVLAAQPRLVVAAVPAFFALLALAAVMRAAKR